MHLYEVLRRPIVTEKNTALQALNKYVFEIADDANKTMIQQAVEKAFNVKVTKVNIVTVRGKYKRVGQRMTHTNPWKKAIITLQAGDKIEYFEGV
jgi:large subunit ribosomal protein L23